MKKADREAEFIFIRRFFLLFWLIGSAGPNVLSSKEKPGSSGDGAARMFHLETSDLTGASLDKAGSIHPLKRVGSSSGARESAIRQLSGQCCQ